MNAEPGLHYVFCVFQETICQGAIPVEHDEFGNLIFHATREEAQQSIDDDVAERLLLASEGRWSPEEAAVTEEYVRAVQMDASGNIRIIADEGGS